MDSLEFLLLFSGVNKLYFHVLLDLQAMYQVLSDGIGLTYTEDSPGILCLVIVSNQME